MLRTRGDNIPSPETVLDSLVDVVQGRAAQDQEDSLFRDRRRGVEILQIRISCLELCIRRNGVNNGLVDGIVLCLVQDAYSIFLVGLIHFNIYLW